VAMLLDDAAMGGGLMEAALFMEVACMEVACMDVQTSEGSGMRVQVRCASK